MHELIKDLALSIVMAWIVGVGAHLVRQPLILAYLAAGFLIGPSGLRWVQSQESIATIAELGLILMMFMIGLEIDLKKVRRAGNVILVTSAVQIIGCVLIGLALFLALGQPLGDRRYDALYLAAAASLSSTVIIVKVLYDKFELDTLPGRITLGVLVAQDLTAILFLAIQPSLNDLQLSVALTSVVRVVALLAATLLISRYALPHLFRLIANLPELVLVGALAWCFAVGEFAHFLGLSRVMGALIAGVSLSTFPYAHDVTAKVTSLRDFFITLFFVALGMTIPLPSWSVLMLALILAAFTWGSRFVTVAPPLYLMRRGLRASLLPAINLAQMSEFSLVLVQIGVQSGHIGAEIAAAASTAFVLLAVLNTFLMMRSHEATRRVIPWLERLGLSDLGRAASDADAAADAPGHQRRILVLGFYRIASSFIAELERQRSPLLSRITVVDFNPDVFHVLQERGIAVHYNDISNPDSLLHAGLGEAEIVISTVPDALLKGTSNEKLVRLARAANPGAKIIATADVLRDVQSLYAAGADYVTLARLDQAAELMDGVEAAEAGRLGELRAKLDNLLKDRREVLP